jgi:hypothetical protein
MPGAPLSRDFMALLQAGSLRRQARTSWPIYCVKDIDEVAFWYPNTPP